MEIPLLKDKEGYFLRVVVKTGARKSTVESLEKDKIRVQVRAYPQDGLANKELLEVLSDFLKIAKSRLEISKGKTSKEKIIRIKGEII